MNVSKLLIILGAIGFGQPAGAGECPDFRGLHCRNSDGNFSDVLSQTKDDTTGVTTYSIRSTRPNGDTLLEHFIADGKSHPLSESTSYTATCIDGAVKFSTKITGTLFQSEYPVPARYALHFAHPDKPTLPTYRFVIGTFVYPDRPTLPAYLFVNSILTPTKSVTNTRLEIAPGADPTIDTKNIPKTKPPYERLCSRK